MMEILKTIQPTSWDVLKTEALPFGEEFIWITDEVSGDERLKLRQEEVELRLYIVNGNTFDGLGV